MWGLPNARLLVLAADKRSTVYDCLLDGEQRARE